MRQHAQRLVELLGGTDTVRTAVDRLYQRLLTDPDLLTYFEDVDVATLRAAHDGVPGARPRRSRGHDRVSPPRRSASRMRTHTSTSPTTRSTRPPGMSWTSSLRLRVDPDLVDDAIIKIAALRPHIVRAGSSRTQRDPAGAARPAPSGETLVGPRILLEPLRTDHADEMAALLDDPALYAYIGGGPASVSELRARYARQVAGPGPDGGEVWLNWVVRRRDGLKPSARCRPPSAPTKTGESRLWPG